MKAFFWLCVALVAALLLRRQLRFGAAANGRRLQQTMKEIYASEHEYRAARLDEFPHLDSEYYENATRRAVELGFRILGDIEDVTISRTANGGRPTLLRKLSDAVGTSLVVYHFKGKGNDPQTRNGRIVDVLTEFSDGTFSTTTNAWAARHIKQPEAIRLDVHPDGTSLDLLLQTHRKRVAAYREEHPNATPIAVDTIEASIEASRRSARLKADFQRKRDHEISREELHSVASDSGTASMHKAADAIADARNHSPSGRRTAVTVLAWIALVILFAVVYSFVAKASGANSGLQLRPCLGSSCVADTSAGLSRSAVS